MYAIDGGGVLGKLVETTLSGSNQGEKFHSTSATEPALRQITGVVAGDPSVTINFSMPSNGASPITCDTAKAWPIDVAGAPNSPCNSININGLMNGAAYAFMVTKHVE